MTENLRMAAIQEGQPQNQVDMCCTTLTVRQLNPSCASLEHFPICQFSSTVKNNTDAGALKVPCFETTEKYRTIQERIEALGNTAAILDERIESEAKRLRINRALQFQGNKGGIDERQPVFFTSSPSTQYQEDKKQKFDKTLNVQKESVHGLDDSKTSLTKLQNPPCSLGGEIKDGRQVTQRSPTEVKEVVNSLSDTGSVSIGLAHNDTNLYCSARDHRNVPDSRKEVNDTSSLKKADDSDINDLKPFSEENPRLRYMTDIVPNLFPISNLHYGCSSDRDHSNTEDKVPMEAGYDIGQSQDKSPLNNKTSLGFYALANNTTENIPVNKESSHSFRIKFSNDLHDLQEKNLTFTQNLKIRQIHYEQDLKRLQWKADQEAREAQETLDKILNLDFKDMNKSNAGGGWAIKTCKFEANAHDAQKVQSHTSTVPEFIDQSDDMFKYATPLLDGLSREQVKQNNLLHKEDVPSPNGNVSTYNMITFLDEMRNSSDENREEVIESSVERSEESHLFGMTGILSRFTLEMTKQYLKEEELRAQFQNALFQLRERALLEKTKAEIAWLEHQKRHLMEKGESQKVSSLIKKQSEIFDRLQHEKTEIKHLQKIYKAAHEERKLLLRQQNEIMKLRKSTEQLQQKLYSSPEGQQDTDIGLILPWTTDTHSLKDFQGRESNPSYSYAKIPGTSSFCSVPESDSGNKDQSSEPKDSKEENIPVRNTFNTILSHEEINKRKHEEINKQKHEEINKRKHEEIKEKHEEINKRKHEEIKQKHDEINKQKHEEINKQKHEEINKRKHEEINKQKHDEINKRKHEEINKQKHEEIKQKHEEINKRKHEEIKKQKHEEIKKQKHCQLINKSMTKLINKSMKKLRNKSMKKLINKFSSNTPLAWHESYIMSCKE
ncbi:centrosome-associated protein 350-like [Protopterus annectens]|uniref:centrosome-associated protein 350-like n=1 Tax=Protopterus annectens TaxID=7888 RepID=UPI001CFB90D3|nr:centrosome-associated protein 350-like [Protopterus annectens]